ncbi:MAG TPA: SRPBCC domain-containing protein [Candidatus Acidoferrales bacterium]|jgi:uncharacterized protein YndB with AHSA1/START domain|nr:SRPBCC domain-containing protein [Candidatus Acidoferrales bacterium]
MPASNAKTSADSNTADRELVFKRILDAPRDLVFEAWTDPKHVARWWGPNGFKTTISEMDVRPGGVWRLVMHGPDGRDYNNKIVFVEVARPERLVYRHQPEQGTEPVTFETTVTFAERSGKTEMTFRMLFPTAEILDHVVKTYGAIEGAKQTLGRLEEHLTKMLESTDGGFITVGERELTIARVFDAPREIVFKAWSKSEHLSRWFGPRGFTLPTCEIDFRAGGVFRFVMRGPDGKDYPFGGTYVEIVEPSRIVFTGNIHDVPGQDVVTTVTFTDQEGKTKLTVHQSYAFESDATRGAPVGWSQTLDHLAEYVAQG